VEIHVIAAGAEKLLAIHRAWNQRHQGLPVAAVDGQIVQLR
jgi:hypothetical protein